MDLIISKSLLISVVNKAFCLRRILDASFSPVACHAVYLQNRKKHWNPHYRKERSKKVLKVVLPESDERSFKEKLTLEEMRSLLKEKGIVPHKKWNKKPMLITCTGGITDPYIPPKGDGKMTLVSKQGLKQLCDGLEIMKGRSYLALRKIQNLDYNFDLPTLAEKGNEIYIDAQKALSEKNEEKLQELVTEKAFIEMMEATKLRTIRWNFIQSLEPPRIVHIRCQEMISKTNIFAQVTLRLFSQQTLAVYDRFGRLIQGSEDTLKDVLEYVVFEKHLTVPDGSWRIHGKIFSEIVPSNDSVKVINQKMDKKVNKNISSHQNIISRR